MNKTLKLSAFIKKLSSVLVAVITILTFILVVILVFTRISGKTPQLFGYQILRISSSSMEPELSVGDIILSKRVDPYTLTDGDIITYHGEYGSYNGKLITHAVVGEPSEQGGTLYLKTMGIANGYVDPEISSEQVVGKMACKIPLLGDVYNFFITPYGLITILGFLAILFINELFSLVKLTKKKEQIHDDKETSLKND